MRNLVLLAIFCCLLAPGLAQAKPYERDDDDRDHGWISALDMGQVGFAGAALLGAVGYLALRRSRRSN